MVVYSSVIMNFVFGDAGVVYWFVSRCVGGLMSSAADYGISRVCVHAVWCARTVGC
jgi:hypothetical protein